MIIKIQNYNKQIIATFILLFIFAVNLSIEYSKYLDFIDEEVYEIKVEVLNIYEKPTKIYFEKHEELKIGKIIA